MLQAIQSGPRALRRTLFAGASGLAVALSLGAGAALAQTAPSSQEDTTQVEEVVVTGFRGSLAQALNVKRREAGAVDVIMAEDIADFPDQNLAEAIQRVPGVAITRDAGEGRNISVRGLGQVLVGEVGDVFGHDDVDRARFPALDVQGLGQAPAEAGDHDLLHLGGLFLRAGRGGLGQGGAGPE